MKIEESKKWKIVFFGSSLFEAKTDYVINDKIYLSPNPVSDANLPGMDNNKVVREVQNEGRRFCIPTAGVPQMFYGLCG